MRVPRLLWQCWPCVTRCGWFGVGNTMSGALASVRRSDGRRYVLDTARVFPACAPTRIQHAVLVPADDSLPVKQVVVRVPSCASLCGFARWPRPDESERACNHR